MITKRLHDINTFSCSDNEVYLSGRDENGKDLSIRDIIKNNNLNLKDNKETNAKEKGWKTSR